MQAIFLKRNSSLESQSPIGSICNQNMGYTVEALWNIKKNNENDKKN